MKDMEEFKKIKYTIELEVISVGKATAAQINNVPTEMLNVLANNLCMTIKNTNIKVEPQGIMTMDEIKEVIQGIKPECI